MGADLKLPVLYWLSGLTCTDENFVEKSGAQRIASELGLVLVIPDTSPRGDEVPDDEQKSYDFGLGAGFYLNATQAPWSRHYNMYDYVVEELPALVEKHFPVDGSKQSIFGHSMGGHGALTVALKNPDKYQSVSAFAPICSPMQCPWGVKALSAYLGDDQSEWLDYDAVALVKRATRPIPMLVDQGSEDPFLKEQLKPELLVSACHSAGMNLGFNQREGYDHSYLFVSSFMENHLRFHHGILSMVV